jgi:hypothetical protein
VVVKKKQKHLNQKVEENNFAKNIMLALRNQIPQQRDKSLIGLVQKRKKMKKITEINHSRSKLLNQSKSAHDRYLKAGYSKYGADDARGRGSKAAKRAAALNKEEFEIIVNALIEEGYDLSSYTWDEMYEVCLDEAVKGASRHDTEMRKAASTERKSGIKNRLSPAAGKDNADKMQRDVKFFDKLTKKNRNVVGLVTKEEVEGLDEGYMPSTQKRADKMMKQVSKLRRTASKGTKGTTEGNVDDAKAKRASEKKHKQIQGEIKDRDSLGRLLCWF